MRNTFILILVLFTVSKATKAQDENYPLNMTKLKGIKAVVVNRILIDTTKFYKYVESNIVDRTFLIDKHGLIEECIVEKPIIHHKSVVKYSYKEGNLDKVTKYEYYTYPDKIDSLKSVTYEGYEYKDNRVSLYKKSDCTKLDEPDEIDKYYYNEKGSLKYIKQYNFINECSKSVYRHIEPIDSIYYCYDNDFLITKKFRKGRIDESDTSIHKLNYDNRILKSFYSYNNGNSYDETINTYNDFGLITESKIRSDRKNIQDNGIMMWADKIVYYYSSDNRLKEIVHFANNVPCFKMTYTYIPVTK